MRRGKDDGGNRRNPTGPHGPWLLVNHHNLPRRNEVLGSLVGKLWVDEKYHENDI